MFIADRPGAVRPREEFDLGRLDAFLKALDPSLEGEPKSYQFSGGASNLTYLVSYPNRDLILRRPPFGRKAKSAHDILREAALLRAIRPVFPYVPAIVATCEDDSVIGGPFAVMERLIGFIPRHDLPEGMSLSPEQARRLCLNMTDRLIELHSIDPHSVGLGGLGKGQGYVHRQIEGWSARLRDARTPDTADFETVMAWLAAKEPTERATRLIHNDYKMDNIVFSPTDPAAIVGVLDWEMATLGDPLMDLGSSLAYWVQADDESEIQAIRRQPSHLPGMMSRDEIVDYYCQKTGITLDRFDYYLIFGTFRLAVIAQQIYARYCAGHAANPAFAGFGHAVNVLERRCLSLIDRAGA